MRIITYNTRGSLGMDGRRSTLRIATVVRGLSPDVICFQEIHRRLGWSGSEDQPELLAAAIFRKFVFQANLRIGFGGYGNGIAYRGKQQAVYEHALPGGREQRGALEVRISQVGGLRHLTVYSTHWGLTLEERLQQADALAAVVARSPRPVVVCGDLNEGPDGPAVQRFIAQSGLIDLGVRGNQATFVSNNPTSRIDYVLVSPDLKATYFEVVSSLASDHLPVLADLAEAQI